MDFDCEQLFSDPRLKMVSRALPMLLRSRPRPPETVPESASSAEPQLNMQDSVECLAIIRVHAARMAKTTGDHGNQRLNHLPQLVGCLEQRHLAHSEGVMLTVMSLFAPGAVRAAHAMVGLRIATTRKVRTVRNGRPVVVMVWMVFVGSAALALPAGANSKPSSKHVRMLPFKTCNSILAAGDFLDNLDEVSPKSVTSGPGLTADVSSCKYASTDEEPTNGLHSFTEGGIGVECLANAIRLSGEGIMPPPGGCYRIDSASVLFAYGSAVEKLASKLPKGQKARHWPANFGRHVLKGVGDTAEFGYDEATGNGYGYLQLDNASLTVETSEGASPSLITLLTDAASTL